MTGGIVATSLIVWPAAPFFLFMHGKDVTIPKGTEITAYVSGVMPLDPAKFAPTSPREPTVASSADAPLAPPKTVVLGQTKDQVVAILGQPQKVASVGAKEIDYYTDMKVVFVDGKVMDVQ
jgi:hypothetical protein